MLLQAEHTPMRYDCNAPTPTIQNAAPDCPFFGDLFFLPSTSRPSHPIPSLSHKNTGGRLLLQLPACASTRAAPAQHPRGILRTQVGAGEQEGSQQQPSSSSTSSTARRLSRRRWRWQQRPGRQQQQLPGHAQQRAAQQVTVGGCGQCFQPAPQQGQPTVRHDSHPWQRQLLVGACTPGARQARTGGRALHA